MPNLTDKVVVITGGTGSLGKVLVRQLLSRRVDAPAKIIIFSRDEAKQHFMRLSFMAAPKHATEEVIYNNFRQLLEFRIGDVRDYHAVRSLIACADVVINAAALKQVPSCEYFPYEATMTNITGAENIVRAIREGSSPVSKVVGVSTDKACKPINVMGMSKAMQERIFIAANVGSSNTSYVCVRYGNVMASRGSVIPLFHDQIKAGGPLTITTADMTRFLMPLEKAVEIIMAAIDGANPGETYVPTIPSATVVNVANALIGDRPIKTKITGIRPGEKIHEIMISEEEAYRTVLRGDYYAIKPMLPEILVDPEEAVALNAEYSSKDSLMTLEETRALLDKHQLLPDQRVVGENEELLV